MCWELTVSITKRNRFSGLAWSLDAAFGIKAIEWANYFRMNRRQFLGLSSATAASTLVPAIVRAESPKGTSHGLITLSNGNFTLKLSPGKGLDCSLVHGSSGVVLARSTCDDVSSVEVFCSAVGESLDSSDAREPDSALGRDRGSGGAASN